MKLPCFSQLASRISADEEGGDEVHQFRGRDEKLLSLAAIEMARDHSLDRADDEACGPRQGGVAGQAAALVHRRGQAVQDFLVLGERFAADDVNLPDQRPRQGGAGSGEAEDHRKPGLDSGPPVAGFLAGAEHRLTECLGLRPVGGREAVLEIGEPGVELLSVGTAAGEQEVEADPPKAAHPAQLQHRLFDVPTHLRIDARSFAALRPLIFHIGGPLVRDCLIPSPECATRGENYIPLYGNVATSQPADYLVAMKRAPDEAPIVPLGRHGLAPDVVAAHQRERLFEATVELVAKRGYRNTSIDHVVKAARVGYVAFYELYEGKEECFLAAFDRIVDEAVEELTEAIAGEEEWPQQMAAALGRLIDMIVADPMRARIALVEVQAAGPSAYSRYEQVMDRAIPKLREGRALSEEAAKLSQTLEEAVLGGVLWIVQQQLVKGELDEAEALLGQSIQIALSPILGDAEAKALADATLKNRSSPA
jgi:AcrR family transcriptional regulator